MSSISSAGNSPQAPGAFSSFAPYIIKPLAAGLGIIPVARDFIDKSNLQRGIPVNRLQVIPGLIEGVKMAPIVGVIVGIQMATQEKIEEIVEKILKVSGFQATLISSGIVGAISAVPISIFNGQGLGKNPMQSFREFTVKQGVTITVQEMFFVGGVSASGKLASIMKEYFGESKLIDYSAAFIAGATGSFLGHPANTIVTRCFQSKNLKIDNMRQLMWGAATKARACGFFSLGYSVWNNALSASFKKAQE